MKVARYEVLGKAALGESSRRDGLMGFTPDLQFGEGRMCGPEENPRSTGGRHRSGQPIIPFPTGRNLFFVATRHFVPGYHHLVPSGQQSVSTCPLFRLHIRALVRLVRPLLAY
jgi:hypothetical protein